MVVRVKLEEALTVTEVITLAEGLEGEGEVEIVVVVVEVVDIDMEGVEVVVSVVQGVMRVTVAQGEEEIVKAKVVGMAEAGTVPV